MSSLSKCPSLSLPRSGVRHLSAVLILIGLGFVGLGLIGFGLGDALAANNARAKGKETAAPAPTLDAVAQNTPGYSEAFPAGVPSTNAWCNGTYRPPGGGAPPSDYSAVTVLASVYPKYGAPDYSNSDARIVVSNAKTYVHLRTSKEWVMVQNQAQDEFAGAHFNANGSPSSAAEMKLEVASDGTLAIDGPMKGSSNLIWFVRRGSFAPGSVDGVYTQVDMKITDPNLKLVANVGADWWRGPEIPWQQGVINNRGAGNSNWVELSPDWSTLVFFSSSTAQLASDPPPPLAESPLSTRPAPAPRVANTPSPCLRTLAPR